LANIEEMFYQDEKTEVRQEEAVVGGELAYGL